MRILVLGAGVIGSIYAAGLQRAGHEVVLLARGPRLAELRTHGLLLEDAESGNRIELRVTTVTEIAAGERFDVVLVPVRAEQLAGTLAQLAAMTDGSDVVFFGNAAGRQAELAQALGDRALFGFPAAGGSRVGPIVRYVLITQQKTMLGEPSGASTARLRRLQAVFSAAGFPTRISSEIGGWLMGHTAFVVPLELALARDGTDAARLAADTDTMRLTVRATRQAFKALRSAGDVEIPTNLRILYGLPTWFVVAYWRRVLSGPRGELWFAAHTRAAPQELRCLTAQLRLAVRQSGRDAPDLERLLGAAAERGR